MPEEMPGERPEEMPGERPEEMPGERPEEMPGNPGPSVTRTKTVEVTPLGGGEYRLQARLTDLSRGGNYGPATADGSDAPSSRVIHDIAITARVRGPGLEITELDVRPLSVPYATCPFVVPALRQLIGRELVRGWRRAVLDLAGGTRGCTHVNTLLLGLSEMQAMVVFLEMNERAPFTAQTKASGEWTAAGLQVAPRLADACYSLRRGGPALAAAGSDEPGPAGEAG
ncbi:MAG: DUF2889 domain-containing protein [Actinomycetota bacterium]|nr:DUF2889 domain-containing protein [Actinomycetota bacterium]